MNKLTKKQIVTIVVSAVIVLALIIAGIALGAKGNNNENKKDTDKKVESVEKEEKDKADKEDSEANKSVEEDKAETSVSGGETADTQTDVSDSTTSKNETNNNKNNTTNNTTNKVTSSTKPSQTVTQPSGGHVHNWTEVKTQVAVPETGHYEPTYAWTYYCDYCNEDLTSVDETERRRHEKEVCPEGVVMKWYHEVGQHWVVDTPSTTEARVTGYKCSCGATREKTQYAGMYTLRDQASWDRLNACHKFFKQGLAGNASELDGNWVTYGNWESVLVCNGSSDGAWMWIFIRDWKLDDYSYLQDGVKEGIIDQEEAKMVEALYEEIPSIFKGAIERVAPEGGTELYNYVEKLIVQAKGNPDAVPSLAGAKGIIPENIPGLYVTIDELRGGFALTFWTE